MSLKTRQVAAVLAVLVTCSVGTNFAQTTAKVPGTFQGKVPATLGVATGVDAARFNEIPPLIEQAIADKKLPGAVVLIGRDNRVALREGRRPPRHRARARADDARHDLRSGLAHQGRGDDDERDEARRGRQDPAHRSRLRLRPGFERYGKGGITIRHLMTHTSGLRPDLDLGDMWLGADRAIELAIEEVPTAPPGDRFVYSDINYECSATIVRPRQRPAARRVREEVHLRAARDEGHDVPAAGRAPAADRADPGCTPYGWPCDGPDMQMLRGVVHDPTARRMGGVAGHAGLFSTAADLSRLLPHALDGGELSRARAFSRR